MPVERETELGLRLLGQPRRWRRDPSRTDMTGTALSPALSESALIEDDLIYDLGMNICEDTEFYLKLGFRVVAVEADPAACATAEERFGNAAREGRLKIINAAISESRDPLTFYVCSTMSAWSTASTRLRDQWAREGARFTEIEVPGVVTDDLVRTYGVPHYAKMDIEGCDLMCMEGLSRQPIRPSYLSFEVDFYYAEEMVACATAMGYRRFALVPQSTVPTQRQPKTPKEGRQVEHCFKCGASGLFGEDLPHPWVSARAIRAKCRAIINQHRASGLLARIERVPATQSWASGIRRRWLSGTSDWYDIHAAP